MSSAGVSTLARLRSASVAPARSTSGTVSDMEALLSSERMRQKCAAGVVAVPAAKTARSAIIVQASANAASHQRPKDAVRHGAKHRATMILQPRNAREARKARNSDALCLRPSARLGQPIRFSISSIRAISAGSHRTLCSASFDNHLASSASRSFNSPSTTSHQKQSIER